MKTTREKIDHFSFILDSYIINFCNNSKTTINTPSIDTLSKLKIALNNYTMIIKELIALLENGERKDKKYLSLSCAEVISQQTDDDILEYIESNWEDDGKPYLDDDNNSSETEEVNSLIKDLLEVTKDMEVVIRKYKWVSQ